MFKQRLKITGKWILEHFVVPILTIAIVATIMTLVIWKAPILMDIALWTLGTFFVLVVLLLLGVFVYWLFIEPFRKGNKE